PRDLFTDPDRFIAPAMQQAKKPFRTRFQLLLRLTLNAGKHPGNQPARLAQLDDGNDCAILVQGDEGPAQVVQLGHRGTPSVICQRRWCHLLRRLPHTISSLEGDGFELSVPRERGHRFELSLFYVPETVRVLTQRSRRFEIPAPPGQWGELSITGKRPRIGRTA